MTVNSSNQLTLSGLNLAGDGGVLQARVTINGVASPLVQVGTLLPSASPVLVPTSGTNLSPTASSLILYGWGFTSNDLVKLTGAYTTGNYPITGFTTTIESANQIAISSLSLPLNVPNVTVTNPGSGYTSAPTVTFSGGGATTQATGYAEILGGQVSCVKILTLGSGYTSAPTVTFSGGGATSQATATSGLGTILLIQAQVIDQSSGLSSGSPKVATILSAASAAPTLTAAPSAVMSAMPATLVLTGTGFDLNGTNVVTFYTDGGSNGIAAGHDRVASESGGHPQRGSQLQHATDRDAGRPAPVGRTLCLGHHGRRADERRPGADRHGGRSDHYLDYDDAFDEPRAACPSRRRFRSARPECRDALHRPIADRAAGQPDHLPSWPIPARN